MAAGERRPNGAGTQRVVRLTLVFLLVLVAMYIAFLAVDRTAPGGTSSAATNGILLLTAIFALFAVFGVVYTVNPAPRLVVVAPDHVTVVGRWGRRRRLPPLERLTVRVVRRYREGWLSSDEVELVELWGEDVPVRSYIAAAGLFSGATLSSERN